MILGSAGDGENSEDRNSAGRLQSRLRGPILYGIDGAKWLLGVVDSAHEKFEAFPRWSRVGFGVFVFLFSVYFGETVRDGVDFAVRTFVVPLLGDFVRIRFGIWVVLSLLVLVMVQTSIINYRLIVMADKSGDEQMRSDIAPDGGEVYPRSSAGSNAGSSGAGTLGGAATGVVIGASFGPAGVFGGAVLGAIVGDEIEKSATRRRKRKSIESATLEALITREVVGSEYVSLESITQWFPYDDGNLVKETVSKMASDPNAPVVRDERGVQLTSLSEARSSLRRLRETSSLQL